MNKMSNCICFNLRRVTRTLTQFYNAELSRQGVRVTQTPILQALRRKDAWSMADLSEILGMERTTLVRNLRPLQREGLLEISGGGHGVPVEVSITPKGEKLMEEFTPAWCAAQEKIIKTLGRELWAALLDDLERADAALKK